MPPLSIESNDGGVRGSTTAAAVAARRRQQEDQEEEEEHRYHHHHQPATQPQPHPHTNPVSQQKNVFSGTPSSLRVAMYAPVLPVPTSSSPSSSSWVSLYRHHQSQFASHSCSSSETSSRSSFSSSIGSVRRSRRRSSGSTTSSKGTTVHLPRISEKQVRWVDLSDDDDDDHDDDGITPSRYCIIPHHEDLTDEEWTNTYYSSTELDSIHREAAGTVRQYKHRQHARRWHNHNHHHYRTSSSLSSSSSSSSSSRSNNNSSSINTVRDSPLGSIRKHLAAITAAAAGGGDDDDDNDQTLLRGLESYTTEGYQRIYNNRRIAQAVVLNEQYKFRYQQYQRQRRRRFQQQGDQVDRDTDLGDDEEDNDDERLILHHFSNHLAYVSHSNTVTCQHDAVERARYDAIEAQKALSQMKDSTDHSIQQLEYETDQQTKDVDNNCNSSNNTKSSSKENNPSSLGCWPVNPLSELLGVVFQTKKDSFVEILTNEN